MSPPRQQQYSQYYSHSDPGVSSICETTTNDTFDTHDSTRDNNTSSQLYDYSSQSSTAVTSQYTAQSFEEEDEEEEQFSIRSSLNGCEISLSSTSYSTTTDHIFVGGNVMIPQQRRSSSGGRRWRDKRKKQAVIANHSRSSPSAAATDTGIGGDTTKGGGGGEANSPTPVMSNHRKQLLDTTTINSNTTVAHPSSNLFLQMGDDEVGNHHLNSITRGDELDSTSFKKYARLDHGYHHHGASSLGVPSDLGEGSALGAAAEGLQFHGLSFASTMDDHGEEEEDYYPTPIKTIKGTKTEEEDRGMTTPKRKEKSSPQSVIDGVSERKQSGSPATLTSFPRYQKPRNKNQRGRAATKSSAPVTRHDSSCDDSETIAYGDDEATFHTMDYATDEDDDDVGTLQRALFHSNPLNKFHDFITGNMCWMNGKNALIGRLQDGCADNANAAAALADDDDMEDYDYSAEDTETLNDEEDGLTTLEDDDYTIEVSLQSMSLMSMAESSKASSHYHPTVRSSKKKKGGKKKKAQPKKQQQLKQKSADQQQQQQQRRNSSKSKSQSPRSRSSPRRAQRRGRSPTTKCGYNSDGESIRRSSQSRSTLGGGTSLSGRATSSVSTSRLSLGSLCDSSDDDLHHVEESIMITGAPSPSPSSPKGKPPPSPPRASVQVAPDPPEQDGDNRERGSDSDGSPSSRGTRDHSVAAESVAESILSHDQAAWMAMTLPSPTRPSPTRYVKDDDHHNYDGNDNANDGGIVPSFSRSAEGRDEVDDDGNIAQSPSTDSDSDIFMSVVEVEHTTKEREPSPFFPRDANAAEGYFKKLLSVGIQLLLNDPPTAQNNTRLNRSGKMFLQFGTQSSNGDGKFEHPRLLWTDGHDVSYMLELLGIQSIRKPSAFELEDSYPFAIPAHSFFLTTNTSNNDGNDNGTSSLLFEAVDELQMIRVTTALRGIIGKLARKIILGENDWVVQMMLASSSLVSGGPATSISLEDLEGGVVPCAMADMTDNLVKKTTLMKQAQERRSKTRQRNR